MATPLLKVTEVMTLLRVSRSTLHQMMKDGRLPVVRHGRAVRFRADSVERLMEPAGAPVDA